MRPVETEQRLFDGTASWIAESRTGVGVAFTECLAPRPGRRVRKTIRKPPGELDLHRVIGRISEVVEHQDAGKLWVRHDVIFRETRTPQNLSRSRNTSTRRQYIQLT